MHIDEINAEHDESIAASLKDTQLPPFFCTCCQLDHNECRCSEEHDHAENADGSPAYSKCPRCGLHHREYFSLAADQAATAAFRATNPNLEA